MSIKIESISVKIMSPTERKAKIKRRLALKKATHQRNKQLDKMLKDLTRTGWRPVREPKGADYRMFASSWLKDNPNIFIRLYADELRWQSIPSYKYDELLKPLAEGVGPKSLWSYVQGAISDQIYIR